VKKQNTTNISLVIPIYNGSLTIVKLVHQCILTFEGLFELEIVLVNDCSEDNSLNVCLDLRTKFPNIITFISLSRNFGEHNAVMAGLNHSTGDYVLTLDDDGQNPPEEALKLINHAVSECFDVVYSSYPKKKHHWLRNLFSFINGKVANLMLQKPSELYLCSFRVMSRFIVNEIIKYDLPYPYVDGLILRSTSNIGTVETTHHQRVAGESGYTLKKLIRLWLNMFTNFSILPLRVASFIGFAFALIGMTIGLFTLYERILNPDLPLGWATIAVLCSILGGVQLMALGMVGEYLGRLFLGMNRQPQFVIRELHHRNKETASI
jgi:undecaprenyl-phosphate 4-deoxy-4-formamido-L-arabinose transferase